MRHRVDICMSLWACVSCNPELQASIFTPDFPKILGLIVSQFAIVGGLVGMLHRLK